MPSAPTVGVVIANHNNSAFVERAIDSVARQTVRNLRAVVVDDASTDRSDEAIRRCLSQLNDTRFSYVRLGSNLGQAGAIRRGMAELDTPFICVLDSDDVWYEEFVARHLAVHLNADFPVGLTYCDSHIVDSDDRMLAGTAWWFDHAPAETSPRKIDASLLPAIDAGTGELSYRPNREITLHPQWSPSGATNTMASMMLRRSFVDLVLVPPDHDLRLYVDFYLSTFAGLLTGVIAIHEALYAYRMHGRNKHSDAAVVGGAYNSSTRPWQVVRTDILQLIRSVLQSQERAICTAFGEGRHAQATTLVENEFPKPQPEPPPPSRGRLLAKLLGRAGRPPGDGHAPADRAGSPRLR